MEGHNWQIHSNFTHLSNNNHILQASAVAGGQSLIFFELTKSRPTGNQPQITTHPTTSVQ